MEDRQIVELFWQRDATAIEETQKKYDRYCFSIAQNILCRDEDAREIVNDAYLGVWNAIPPHRPERLSAFLGKITRRLAMKKLRDRNAVKRFGSEVSVSLDELEDCIPSSLRVDDHLEEAELTKAINRFLASLPAEERRVFLRRYWFFDSVNAICTRYGFSQSKVKSMLSRSRKKLLLWLQREDLL